jgi:response regulator RpfG family c-di-GMP phosphodiesterase/uncharacterized membrane protein SirB2
MRGAYENRSGEPLEKVISGPELVSCKQAYKNKCLVYEDEYLVAYCGSKNRKGSLLYLSGLPRPLNEMDKHLVKIFAQNVQIAFDNVLMTKDIEDTQREVIERIGQAMEHHFGEGKHIQRMVKICDVLGRGVGLSKGELNTLCLAVPLHDIGKAKVPDGLALDPQELSEEEYNTLRNHAEFGYNLLKGSNRPLIKTAALIARDHHEYWNGGGYPQGKSGNSIHIFCRITALADAYDMLRSKRKNKPALPKDEVLKIISQQKGQQFDPSLVDVLLANLDEIEKIIQNHPDNELRLKSSKLNSKLLKVLPHLVDTVLIVSAITLCVLLQQYPLVDAWVTEKLLALIMYVFMVTLALRLANNNFMRIIGFVGAISWVAFAGAVAVSKQAILF